MQERSLKTKCSLSVSREVWALDHSLLGLVLIGDWNILCRDYVFLFPYEEAVSIASSLPIRPWRGQHYLEGPEDLVK